MSLCLEKEKKKPELLLASNWIHWERGSRTSCQSADPRLAQIPDCSISAVLVLCLEHRVVGFTVHERAAYANGTKWGGVIHLPPPVLLCVADIPKASTSPILFPYLRYLDPTNTRSLTQTTEAVPYLLIALYPPICLPTSTRLYHHFIQVQGQGRSIKRSALMYRWIHTAFI